MQVIAGFSGNGHCASFCRMLKLPVAAPLSDKLPTVIVQQAQDLAYFHVIATRVLVLFMVCRVFQYTPTVVASASS
jgi:hypothetical protein